MLVRRFFRIAFPLLAVTGAAFLLSGCHRRCGWSASPEDKANYIAKQVASELNLNAEQKIKLDKIKADLLSRKGDFQAVHAGFKDMMLGQFRATTLDTAKVNAGLDEREAKIKELRGFLVGELAEFHAMLDSTQREKLASRLEKMGMGRHCR